MRSDHNGHHPAPDVEDVDGITRGDLAEWTVDADAREQDVGGGLTVEDPETVPDSEILRTSGVLSTVPDAEGETVGHIYMSEWDDIEDPMEPIGQAARKPGVSILLQSSPGSFHVYNLSVRPFEEHLRDVAAGTGDLGHVRWAARRGYFVLRILAKKRETGGIYKPEPEILRVFEDNSDDPQSQGHLSMFADMADRQGEDRIARQLRGAVGRHRTVGTGIDVDHYQTVTDAIKEARRDGA